MRHNIQRGGNTGPGRRIREVRKRKRIILFVVLIVLIIAAIWGLGVASHAENFKIKDIVVQGSERVGQKWIAVDADTVMDKPLFGIFSRHNSFLVPEGKIEAKIMERPEIASVEVEVEGDVLQINVSERSSVARVCGDSCFDMDDQGVLFAVATDDSLLRITSNEPSKVKIGAVHFNTKSIAELQVLIQTLENISVSVKEVRIDSADEITLYQAHGAYIRAAWKTLRFAPESLSTILASESVSTTTLFAGEYLDLRFEDSAYFK